MMQESSMKKLLAFILIAGATTGAFAKKWPQWTNNVGGGITGNYSQIGADNTTSSDVIEQFGIGLEGIYLGYHENGFTAKADYAIGATASKDVTLQDKDTNIGFFTNIALGAGYSVPVTENLLFSFTGMVGADVSLFGDEKEDISYYYENSDGTSDEAYSADYAATVGLITLSIGGDILAKYSVSEHFGFFANISARWVIGGIETHETTYTYQKERKQRELTAQTSKDYDLLGKFRVEPTIGVIWTF